MVSCVSRIGHSTSSTQPSCFGRRLGCTEPQAQRLHTRPDIHAQPGSCLLPNCANMRQAGWWPAGHKKADRARPQQPLSTTGCLPSLAVRLHACRAAHVFPSTSMHTIRPPRHPHVLDCGNRCEFGLQSVLPAFPGGHRPQAVRHALPSTAAPRRTMQAQPRGGSAPPRPRSTTQTTAVSRGGRPADFHRTA